MKVIPYFIKGSFVRQVAFLWPLTKAMTTKNNLLLHMSFSCFKIDFHMS